MPTISAYRAARERMRLAVPPIYRGGYGRFLLRHQSEMVGSSSVHHLCCLLQEPVIGQLLEHELRQVGPREVWDDGLGWQMLTAAVGAGAHSVRQHGRADDGPIQMTLFDHSLIEFVISSTVVEEQWDEHFAQRIELITAVADGVR